MNIRTEKILVAEATETQCSRGKMKLKLNRLLIPVFLFTYLECNPTNLANPCDPKSDSFFTQLILSSASESGFCLGQIVNSGNPYPFSDFTFYKNIPVSIFPTNNRSSEIRLVPPPPEGLVLDSNNGVLSGQATTTSERIQYRVLRKGAEVAQITIEVRDLVASRVYGQFGNLNSNVENNDGFGGIGVANSGNLSFPDQITTDDTFGLYSLSGSRILYFPNGEFNQATRVYGQKNVFSCDVPNLSDGNSCLAGPGPTAETLHTPRGLIFTKEGNLIVSDNQNRRILSFASNATNASRVFGPTDFNTQGGGGTSISVYNSPYGLSESPKGGFYLADRLGSRVLYFPKDSNLPTEVYGQPDFNSNGAAQSASGLNSPRAVVADSKDGIYVADTDNNRVLYFPTGSKVAERVYGQSTFFNSAGSVTRTGLFSPGGVALDQSENLYVADTGSSRVLIFPKTNQTSGISAFAVIGQFNNFNCNASNNNGSCISAGANASTLYFPAGVHFDKKGKLYIADTSNNRILAY